MNAITFDIEKKSGASKARRGVLRTLHGDIHTPAFVAVGTKGTVKGLTVEQLETLGLQTLIANTYHLHLQPGSKEIAAAGGLHNFMQWHKPLLTDSGGFQYFHSALPMARGNRCQNFTRRLGQQHCAGGGV
jgi:tRNA-guanine transglycosylases, various specificities